MRLKLALVACVAVFSSSCALVGMAPSCDGFEIIGYFEQVGDLVENANVQSADVEIGRIQSIDLSDWKAKVTMCIDEGEKISKDVKATVRTTSLLGEKFVDLAVQRVGPPYLEQGDVLDVDQTGKATELEEVFGKLASVLGTGNLEQINRFTTAQANILRDRTQEVRRVLDDLREFTGLLAGRKQQIAQSIDALDSVARTIVQDQSTLTRFLESFASSAGVLAEQKEELENLLVALDRFSNISVQLLQQTEGGLNEQFQDLRPVLRTLAANSADITATLQTLATFTQWFPETMPGDYVQLDVCQAPPHEYGQGRTCPEAVDNDDPDRSAMSTDGTASSGLELIMRNALRGRD